MTGVERDTKPPGFERRYDHATQEYTFIVPTWEWSCTLPRTADVEAYETESTIFGVPVRVRNGHFLDLETGRVDWRALALCFPNGWWVVIEPCDLPCADEAFAGACLSNAEHDPSLWYRRDNTVTGGPDAVLALIRRIIAKEGVKEGDE